MANRLDMLLAAIALVRLEMIFRILLRICHHAGITCHFCDNGSSRYAGTTGISTHNAHLTGVKMKRIPIKKDDINRQALRFNVGNRGGKSAPQTSRHALLVNLFGSNRLQGPSAGFPLYPIRYLLTARA